MVSTCPQCGANLVLANRCFQCGWVKQISQTPSRQPASVPQQPPTSPPSQPSPSPGYPPPQPVKKNIWDEIKTPLIVGVISFFIFTVFLFLPFTRKYFGDRIEENKLIILVIGCIGLFLLSFLLFYHQNKTLIKVGFAIWFVFLVFLLFKDTAYFAFGQYLPSMDLGQVFELPFCMISRLMNMADVSDCWKTPEDDERREVINDYSFLEIKHEGETPEAGKGYTLEIEVTNPNDEDVFVTGVNGMAYGSYRRSGDVEYAFDSTHTIIKPYASETFTLNFPSLPNCPSDYMYFDVTIRTSHSGSGRSGYGIEPRKGMIDKSRLEKPISSFGPLDVYAKIPSKVITLEKPQYICCSQGEFEGREMFAWERVDPDRGVKCGLPNKDPVDQSQCNEDCVSRCQPSGGSWDGTTCTCNLPEFEVVLIVDNEHEKGTAQLGDLLLTQTFEGIPNIFRIECSDYEAESIECPGGKEGNCIRFTPDPNEISGEKLIRISCNGYVESLELEDKLTDSISASMDYSYSQEEKISVPNCVGTDVTGTTLPITIPSSNEFCSDGICENRDCPCPGYGDCDGSQCLGVSFTCSERCEAWGYSRDGVCDCDPSGDYSISVGSGSEAGCQNRGCPPLSEEPKACYCNVKQTIMSKAAKYDIPQDYALAIGDQESNLQHFDGSGNVIVTDAGGGRKAIGMYQILVDVDGSTACGYTESQVRNLANNIECGMMILREKCDRFDCDLSPQGVEYPPPEVRGECPTVSVRTYYRWDIAARGYVGWGCKHSNYVELVNDRRGKFT